VARTLALLRSSTDLNVIPVVALLVRIHVFPTKKRWRRFGEVEDRAIVEAIRHDLRFGLRVNGIEVRASLPAV
jgi:hypothetical protein